MFSVTSQPLWKFKGGRGRALRALPFILFFVALTSFQGAWGAPSSLGNFFTTFYYIPMEKDYSDDQTAVIRDMSGHVLASVNARFKKDLDIEGTGILRSNITVNFAGRVDDEIRYRISSARWGWGVGQCALKPYHTIAVDPTLIPLGTVVYIPAVKGALLPDGTRHNGIFYAEDIGSRIMRHHVDLFASEGPQSYFPFERVGINTGTFVDIYKVRDPDPNGCQNKPPLYQSLRGERWGASSVAGLVKLADEYAALGQTQNLRATLGKIHEMQGHWRLEGNELADNELSSFLLNRQRSAIESQNSSLSAGTMDEVTRSAYAREYNGDTLNPGEVVLTFDDGPHPRYSPLIHATLKEGGAQAAFFEVGEMVSYHPELTRAYAQEGWVIGNHSFNHPELTRLSDEQVADQINRTQKLIDAAMGGPDAFNDYFQMYFARFFQFPRKLYGPEFLRSPYGARSARTMNIIMNTVVGQSTIDGKIQNDSFYHIMWDIDSLDWQDHSPASIEARVFRQLEANNRHGVILMHDIHPQSAEAFQLILPRLQREGYKILSLYDMIAEAQEKAAQDFNNINTRP